MSPTNYDDMNMYCSDDDYSSEHPYDGNQSANEYDSDVGYYDDHYPNPPETLMVSPGRSRSEERLSRRVYAPPLVQTTSVKTSKMTGCATTQELREKWDQELQDEWEKELIEAQELEERKKMEAKEIEDAKAKAEKAEKAKWDAIMASLPTESRRGKKKRLTKEREDRRLKSKLAYLARKKRRKMPKKSLPFGHRRNGGGKRRAKTEQLVGKDADRLTETIKKRRAARRKLAQVQKKEAEAKRARDFELFGPEKETRVVTVNYITDEEVDEDDEEAVMLKALEKRAELEQSQKVRQIQIRKAGEEDLHEAEKKAAADAKFRAEFRKKEAALVDARENGGWTTVKTKRAAPKSAPIKKSKKKVLAINFVTPKMLEAEKIKAGRESMKDSRGMQNRLIKTRMCASVGKSKPCRHGSHCRYAHSVDELRVADCFFKDACRHVRKTATGYRNSHRRRCAFIHPGETMQNYCGRVGLEYTEKKKPVAKPMAIPMPRLIPRLIPHLSSSVTPPTNVWRTRVAHRTRVKPKVDVGMTPGVGGGAQWTDVKHKREKKSVQRRRTSSRSGGGSTRSSSKRKEVICSSVGTGKPCRHGKKCRFRHVDEVHSHDQVVLRVPRGLAVQAMQHAVAAGIKNFKIVVV